MTGIPVVTPPHAASWNSQLRVSFHAADQIAGTGIAPVMLN
jgi:hypothetical protein